MIEPFTLAGHRVTLEPLSPAHVDDLVAAASENRETYGWTAVPDGVDAMRTHVQGLLADAAAGQVVPFAQRRASDGVIVGCTRYMELRFRPGRAVPDEVEVGGTWLAASAQRTAVNTEAKLLLFSHAFDDWHVQRLQLCTDARNERSRSAIARVGASFEGVLRQHRTSHVVGEEGRARDTAVYSIVSAEWPAVRARLTGMLGAG